MYKLTDFKKVYTFDGSEFTLAGGVEIGGKELLLPCRISYCADNKNPFIVEINDLVIINFFPWGKEEREEAQRQGINLKRNIWAFNQNGEKVWEIMEQPNLKSSYSSILIKDDSKSENFKSNIPNGTILVGSTFGVYYILDVTNGHVSLIPGQRTW